MCAPGCRFLRSDTTTESWIGNSGPIARYLRGQTIFVEGDQARWSYKMIEGAVRYSRILPDGHRQIHDIFLPDDTFGLEPARTFSGTAEAIGDVVLLRCPRSCIARQSEQPDLRQAMMEMLSGSLSAAQDHLTMLGHRGAKERVACFLVYLTKGEIFGADRPLELPCGRQDMGDYLGLSLETTCRAITDLRVSQIIAIPNRRQIIIRDLPRLRGIAGI
jgi:CRP/FNR family nitrogen fixation transcriptional regulator